MNDIQVLMSNDIKFLTDIINVMLNDHRQLCMLSSAS